MKSVAGAIMLAVALAGCSMHTTDRDTSAQAFARDTRAADCDRRAATAGSKAQIERDIRWRQYQDCLGR